MCKTPGLIINRKDIVFLISIDVRKYQYKKLIMLQITPGLK